ncbi:MAG: glycosyltransferase, partial [Acidimicrobiia bacterium]
MSSDLMTPRASSAPAPTVEPVVDIVLPVFNEAGELESSVRRLHAYLTTAFPLTWQITIVDNASTDRTAAIAQRLSDELLGVHWRHLDRKGRGHALREAWTASSAQVVAYMDIDLSTDLDALLPMVAPLASGHSEIAIGSRLAPGASVARGPKREFISRSYNLMVRAMFATQIRDMQCGFKAVRADVARELLPAVDDDEWFFDTELLLLAERNGLRIHEIPVDWVDDPGSTVNIAKTATADVRGALRLARTFATGNGRVAFSSPRPALDDDFGRKLVSFGVIGVLSTIASLLLFLLLRTPLGAFGANACAVTATFAANTWLNARYTARVERPRWRRACAIYSGALLLTTAALSVAGSLDANRVVELITVGLTWTLA